MSAVIATLREIADEQRSCAAQCIHAPKAKATYTARAERIESAIKSVETALAACRSIRFAVNNAARYQGEYNLNDIEAADRLAREALGESTVISATAVLKKRSVKGGA
ncbi:MAG: hypothetical protein HZA93_13135 [Verrucomicrobia bacterium]|nr:hypothetical protein [Verrucomicrobiota bacterium]